MRNKVTAALLAFFLGGFGIHRFYLGQTVWGIIYALLFWTGVPFVLSVLDALLLLIMPQEVFDAKYNRDTQVARRNQRKYQRKQRTHGVSVKKRHQVKKENLSNRELTSRAKQKVKFKKSWEEGKKAFKKYQFDDAEEAYFQAMEIQPNDPKLLFDIACLFSIKEETERAFEYLELAVSQGFKPLEEIQNNPALAYLRIQDSFLNFAKAGFKRPTQSKKQSSPELLQQLRQLDLLKKRGLLTELEFEDERKKLLH